MKLKKVLALGAAAALAISLVGCSRVKITQMEITDIPTMKVGQTHELVVMMGTDKMDVSQEKLDKAIEKMEIAYESSDEKVATVDENGVVTAVAEGKATITVKADELTAETDVKVEAEESVEEENAKDTVSEEVVDESEVVSDDKAREDDAKDDVKGTASNKDNGGNNTTGGNASGNVNGGNTSGNNSNKPAEQPKPVCGAVGHSQDGTCPACGSTYTTPAPQPTPEPEKPVTPPANNNSDGGVTEPGKPMDNNTMIVIPPTDPNEYDAGNGILC